MRRGKQTVHRIKPSESGQIAMGRIAPESDMERCRQYIAGACHSGITISKTETKLTMVSRR